MTQFGDFQPLCTNVPSYPWCNLFYRQLLRNNTHLLLPISNNTLTAPVGVNPTCGILRVVVRFIPTLLIYSHCSFLTSLFILVANPPLPPKGRIELRLLLSTYLILLPIQLITTVHHLSYHSYTCWIARALFWVLLANGVVATQVVEDGTMSSLVLHMYPNGTVTLNVLREMKPMWFYILSMVLFVLAQLAWFLLGGRICSGSNKTIDGSFIATMFESAALGALVLAWKSITEDSWDDDDSSPGAFY
ncbi:hypothetical protein BDQ17DRAFT_1392983 [Cyathus striatus]|nr:hypothetical protein BDQ17DRAFT_1392983 [Cyathus striatus]